MAIYKITQVRSRIGSNKKQRATLDTLGLHKIRQTVEREATPSVEGMIKAIHHLVKVEELK
ncbi:MAG: 50S ribosomal protein L30 [Prevotellaceae bacterium]|jgi:large subunit ribosomal protein L30|nr:50S ribosomal protein L30 [Prevotellaceae bacterium]